jgi:SNF2 family DNA or RNA helicase
VIRWLDSVEPPAGSTVQLGLSDPMTSKSTIQPRADEVQVWVDRKGEDEVEEVEDEADGEGDPFFCDMWTDSRTGKILERHDDPVLRRECYRFFKLNVPKGKDLMLESSIPLPGLLVELYVYQTLGVYWMAKQGGMEELYGGCNADEMGLGKTIEVIALMIVRQGVSLMIEDLDKNPRRHLPEGHAKNQRCPPQVK